MTESQIDCPECGTTGSNYDRQVRSDVECWLCDGKGLITLAQLVEKHNYPMETFDQIVDVLRSKLEGLIKPRTEVDEAGDIPF